MIAIIYSLRNLAPVKQSYQYFSFYHNYGQKQIAKPKCSVARKLKNVQHLTKLMILASTSNVVCQSAFGVNTSFAIFRKKLNHQVY